MSIKVKSGINAVRVAWPLRVTDSDGNPGKLRHLNNLCFFLVCWQSEVLPIWIKLDQDKTIWENSILCCVLLPGSYSCT